MYKLWVSPLPYSFKYICTIFEWYIFVDRDSVSVDYIKNGDMMNGVNVWTKSSSSLINCYTNGSKQNAIDNFVQ